jgi:hypothetical protein
LRFCLFGVLPGTLHQGAALLTKRPPERKGKTACEHQWVCYNSVMTDQAKRSIVAAAVLATLTGCGMNPAARQSRTQVLHALTADQPEALTLKVPGASVMVTLDETGLAADQQVVSGHYSIPHAPGVVERGTVGLDCDSVTLIRPLACDSRTPTVYFAAAFFVSNQGSGVLYYAGLFAFDGQTRHSTHLDSYFLGDRIQGVDMCDAVGAVKVTFSRHAADQAYAQYPTETAQVNLYVQDDLTWRPYKGMHPSWDRNNDGINDCEDDGTCDDSQDYTRPRLY